MCPLPTARMKVAENSNANGLSQSDPGAGSFHSWLNHRGFWVAYCAGTYLLHLLFLIQPFLNTSWAWTLTNVVHSVLTYIMLHYKKGSVWSYSQGGERSATQWEQIDDGEQYTMARKILTIVPIVIFFLASFYSKYEPRHFAVNSVFMLLAVLPKLPMFHGVRVFGINKY